MARLLDLTFRSTTTFAALLFLAGCGGKADITFVGEDGASGGGGGGDLCGNGKVDADEDCDDENTQAGDGCNATCEGEASYVCSGEPSVCAKTCGNGTLDAGEACEDGNVETKDGCDASCQIEGTCEEPAKLTFKAAADGSLVAKIDSTTNGGGKQFDTADCNGDDAGAGPDRIYSFVLENPADLSIKLSAGFNSTLRLLKSKPCEAKDTLVCSNEDGNDAEALSVTELAAGTYFVVVDGASGTSKGEFTLTVTANCPLSSVKIEEIDSYYRAGAYLHNYSDSCGVNLKRLGMGFTYYTNEYPVELPDRLLEPGESVAIISDSFDNSDANEIPGDFFVNSSSGAAFICRGTCNFDSGTSILDAVSWGASAPSLPAGVTMDPSGIVAIDTSTDPYTDYRRVEFEGANPTFKATDWGLSFYADPDLFPSSTAAATIVDGWLASGTPLSIGVIEDADEGRVFEITTNLNGFNGYYASTPIMTPSLISYKFRPSEGTSSVFNLSTAADSQAVFVAQYSGSNIIFYSGGAVGAISIPLDVGTWHQVELRDIDWTAHTYDVYLDGALVTDPNDSTITAEDFLQYGYPDFIDAVEGVWIGNQSITASQFADIVMR